jgi:phage repressor protein C with HTH and peptisase S24 domain
MTHHGIWSAIEGFARSLDMSCSGLARNSGMDPTTFNKSKRLSADGKPRWPSTQSIAKILESTGKDVVYFAKFLPKNERPGIWVLEDE